MKRVRYVLGAVGAAPALGLMMPNAAATVDHAPKGSTKTVSLAHSKMELSGCTGTDRSTGAGGPPGHSLVESAFHTPSTGCIGGARGTILPKSTGLDMRTRVYSIVGTTKTKVYSNFVGGTIKSKSTTWWQGIHRIFGGSKQQVCGAIVSASHHSAPPRFGPACVTFPS